MPPSLHTGTLLLAPPMLQDPNFRRSVVLLCEHNAAGSFGLILNRPLDVDLGEVLEEMIASDAPVGLGGPVQPNTLHYIHRFEDVPEAIPVTEEIYWGGHFEEVKDLVRRGAGPRELRFFLGYAGWAPGQLEAEIEDDGWIQTQGDVQAVFPEEPTELWRTVLRRMGGEYALLSTFPENPRLN